MEVIVFVHEALLGAWCMRESGIYTFTCLSLVLASESKCKGNNDPSVESLMVDEERKPGHWLGSMLWVTFSASTLMVGWQGGHNNLYHLSLKVFFKSNRESKPQRNWLTQVHWKIAVEMEVGSLCSHWLEFIMDVLRSRCGHCVFALWFLSIFFSLPNLSGRRLDVYHTLTHGVALVRI